MIVYTMHKESDHKKNFALAIETSGSIGSIAIGQGSEIIESRTFDTPRNHAAEFLPTVQNLCLQHSILPQNIGYIYVSIGPGSFTGLRIGITVARTMALAVGSRIVPVPTLEVIVQNADDLDQPPDKVVVMLDAKRQRVYAASFTRQNGKYVCDDEPAEVEPSAYLARQDSNCVVIGEGAACYRKSVEEAGCIILPESLHTPRAEMVFHLGAARAQADLFVPPRDLVPLYIRLPEAEEKWMLRQG